MKKTLLLVTGVCSLLALPQVKAGDYYNNFNNRPKIGGSYTSLSDWVALTGTGSAIGNGSFYDGSTTTANPNTTFPYDWITTDANQNDYGGYIGGWSLNSSDLWAMLGSAGAGSPMTPNVELWTPLSQPSYGTNLSFKVIFGITASTNEHNDTFGWNFRDATGAELFKIEFTPNATDPTNELDVHWLSATGADTDTHISIFRAPTGGKYNLDVEANFALHTFKATISNSGTFTFNGTIPNTATSVDQVDATMDLADTSNFDAINGYQNAGDNVMMFDNYFVGVPEPSTVLLTLSGLGVLAYWRRRMQRA